MKTKGVQVLLLVVFIVLAVVYYQFDFGAPNTDKVFITITTFFFSIFTGFFITRQGTRYTKIREIISTFDGKMSGIYRVSGNLSLVVQEKIGAIIKDHYTKNNRVTFLGLSLHTQIKYNNRNPQCFGS